MDVQLREKGERGSFLHKKESRGKGRDKKVLIRNGLDTSFLPSPRFYKLRGLEGRS
jgi:hypothetical protein